MRTDLPGKSSCRGGSVLCICTEDSPKVRYIISAISEWYEGENKQTLYRQRPSLKTIEQMRPAIIDWIGLSVYITGSSANTRIIFILKI